MIKYLLHRIVARMERRYDYDATYLHELVDISPSAARRYVKAQTAGRWQGPAPRDAWHAAAIGGALVEDCGPCVQIASDIALEAGMPPATIAALLSGAATDPDAQLGFDYARALLAGGERFEELRDAVQKRFGKQGLVALSMMAMYARNFPVLKRALGHAKACRKVRVGSAEVAVAQELKAA
ncbi:MAG: hypothetical protein JO261_00375 [Alphaproteobacteria bacterium]|nr:hypothetical protein [Alphaproteobacteria bacterium]MBV9692129.1 hypothetical protein [Alphaproteobacteria bacterium]